MSIEKLLRIDARLTENPCFSDKIRFDAWNVALQGANEKGFYPSVESFGDYYARTEIGQKTIQDCNIRFTMVHNFFLEQFFYGGAIWLGFLVTFFSILIFRHRNSYAGIGLAGFLVFLFFSPTYWQFYMFLFLWITVLFYSNDDV